MKSATNDEALKITRSRSIIEVWALVLLSGAVVIFLKRQASDAVSGDCKADAAPRASEAGVPAGNQAVAEGLRKAARSSQCPSHRDRRAP